MCGIVGLFIKTPALQPRLGELICRMLVDMSDRGPDSAGLAVYRNPADHDTTKVVLAHPAKGFDWKGLVSGLRTDLGVDLDEERRGTHTIIKTPVSIDTLLSWLAAHYPEVQLVSAGHSIEIFKEAGAPHHVVDTFRLSELAGTHAIGHTRMATESAVTTDHSHPFSTGEDLCLVHNGSLSNHNRLRLELQRRGVHFNTDNDSEVAAGYLSWRLAEGDTLRQALTRAIEALDGFYTFAVGTRDGFAVLRDPIACKHAVIAETENWAAMATEYRALAGLPGVDGAQIWEPEPGVIYSWGHPGKPH